MDLKPRFGGSRLGSSRLGASCLWNDDLVVDSDGPHRWELDVDDLNCDVLIVGAGFTGLWTAYYLLTLNPDLHIVIAESHKAGFGASGRNGGWCSPLLPMSLGKLAREHGEDAAVAARRTMVSTVDEVGRRAAEMHIDCSFTKGGSLELLRNRPQVRRAEDHLEQMRRLSIPESEIRLLSGSDLEEVVRARGARAAVLDVESAVFHPGRLAQGLARAVRAMGCTLIEGLTVLRIEPGRAVTDRGDVTATKIIRATEAFSPRLRGERRAVLPLYSLMIATEPLDSNVWNEIGLEARQSFTDGRRVLIYGQRTGDDRIAFGGRGAPYHFGSRIRPDFDTDRRVERHLIDALHDVLPQTAGARITHHWGGPLGAPRDWTCSMRFDPRTGLGSAGGYVGDGVATSNLAGRTLADLVLERTSDLISLPWVQHKSPKWEPEPARWFAVNGMAKLAGLADRIENRSGRGARSIDSLVRRVSGG